jgi:uncharacterized membrane protein YkgB
MNKLVKRALRVASFALGVGITALGAGSVIGLGAAQSALFGAIMAVLGLIGALSFTYAAKGSVPESDFDTHINSAIENVQSKNKK